MEPIKPKEFIKKITDVQINHSHDLSYIQSFFSINLINYIAEETN